MAVLACGRACALCLGLSSLSDSPAGCRRNILYGLETEDGVPHPPGDAEVEEAARQANAVGLRIRWLGRGSCLAVLAWHLGAASAAFPKHRTILPN